MVQRGPGESRISERLKIFKFAHMISQHTVTNGSTSEYTLQQIYLILSQIYLISYVLLSCLTLQH